ncbi:MAG: 2-hydroxyacid dehydrogenase [Oscillibacter sp.]|nr:2-hydroxyacid dehydrogenase [Oscillibacter sp.]
MKILIVGTFPDAAKERIRASFPQDWTLCIASSEEGDLDLSDVEVVIPEHIPIDSAFLDRAPRLRLVQTGAGYDNVDIDACTARGVRVCNAAGVNATAVAEHAMALLLGWYKNIPYLDSFMKAHSDEGDLSYQGGELEGKTIGLIGLGNIGKKVAAYCGAFGMRVLGYSRRTLDIPGVTQVDLDTLYHQSDVVSLHLPLTGETRGMIDRDVFSRLKPGAILINTSRGGLVNEADLISALQTGTLRGACLDVYTKEPLPQGSPLRDLPNVILTPHTAGLPDGVKFHAVRYQFFVSNLRRLMQGERPEHALNEV